VVFQGCGHEEEEGGIPGATDGSIGSRDEFIIAKVDPGLYSSAEYDQSAFSL
jgi:hypothetical protein